VIDIVKDYAAIGAGTAQATVSRAIGVGRAGAGQVAWLTQGDFGASVATFDPRALVGHGQAWASGLVRSDLDELVGRLGLVKKSELNAVRQQLHRLERRLGEVRGER
jgi:hypothetical protein